MEDLKAVREFHPRKTVLRFFLPLALGGLLCGLVLLLLASGAVPAAARGNSAPIIQMSPRVGWLIQAVEAITTYGTSLALDNQGRPHVSYLDPAFLKYAFLDATGWVTTVVDEAGYDRTPVETSLALGPTGPHILYCTGWPVCDLRYAYLSGTAWITQSFNIPVSWAGMCGSLALDADGRPHISYYHSGLNYGFLSGTTWITKVVDSTSSSGLGSTLALDKNGRPHILYYRYGPGITLTYAYLSGTVWVTEIVNDRLCWYASLALDSLNRPHISYCRNQDLIYAYRDGPSSWVTETVDSTGDVGEFNALALDSDDRPHIIYYDRTNKRLKYTYRAETGWISEEIENVGSWIVGRPIDLVMDSANRPHISYSDMRTGAVKYAVRRTIYEVFLPLVLRNR